MICPSCGGIVGRDCFNPEECAAIGHAQEQQHRRATDVHGDALTLLLSQVANLEARVQHLEKLTNANP